MPVIADNVLAFIIGIVFGTFIHIAHFQINRTITLRRIKKEIDAVDFDEMDLLYSPCAPLDECPECDGTGFEHCVERKPGEPIISFDEAVRQREDGASL